MFYIIYLLIFDINVIHTRAYAQHHVVEQSFVARTDASDSSFKCNFERNLRACVGRDNPMAAISSGLKNLGHARATISSALAAEGVLEDQFRALWQHQGKPKRPFRALWRHQSKPEQPFRALWRHWGKPGQLF